MPFTHARLPKGLQSRREELKLNKSPYYITKCDEDTLLECRGFQIVREFLTKEQGGSLCNEHSQVYDREAWLLHRDIIYAIILPILQVHRHATRLAKLSLHSTNAADLELAFRGEARGAFTWLNCFIMEESDWCAAKECAACVVVRSLQSEPAVRLALVASRISHHLHPAFDEQPTLPMFTFWIPCLRSALENDPFWGPGYWEHIEPLADWLEEGVEDLIRQCYELEAEISMSAQKSETALITAASKHASKRLPYTTTSSSTKLRHSRLAKRQLKLMREESEWKVKIIIAWLMSLLTNMAKVENNSHRPGPNGVRRLRSMSA